jgi:FAD/FMN-containing dehydrogenase
LIKVGQKEIVKITDEREQAVLKIAEQHTQNLKNATGEVRKAASGYRLEKVLEGENFNLVPLFCGAQGTLGIVTKAVLKLVPIPNQLSLLIISAQKLEDIPVIVDEIFKWNPEAIETFDKNTFAMARQHLALHADRALPYVDSEAELFILAEFSEKTEEETEGKAKGCFEALKEKGYFVKFVSEPTDIKSIWEVRRNSFLLMRDHNPKGFKAVPCIEDVVVPVSALAEFIGTLHQILDRRGIKYGFHGHIGEGSLRIVPVFDVNSPTLMSDITGLMEEVFALIKRLHGNISADHSDGIIRSPFLKEFYGEELYSAFVEIKNIFDPLGIMNPGKKIGVEVSDIEKYFDKA